MKQNYYPIKDLDMFCKMNSGQLLQVKEQYDSLLAVKDKPHVLDDYTVERVIICYTEQKELLKPERKQFEKWEKEENLNITQKEKINEAYKIIDEKEKIIDNILLLAKELEKGTIDKIMSKSDLELGLEFLMKGFKL